MKLLAALRGFSSTFAKSNAGVISGAATEDCVRDTVYTTDVGPWDMVLVVKSGGDKEEIMEILKRIYQVQSTISNANHQEAVEEGQSFEAPPGGRASDEEGLVPRPHLGVAAGVASISHMVEVLNRSGPHSAMHVDIYGAELLTSIGEIFGSRTGKGASATTKARTMYLQQAMLRWSFTERKQHAAEPARRGKSMALGVLVQPGILDVLCQQDSTMLAVYKPTRVKQQQGSPNRPDPAPNRLDPGRRTPPFLLICTRQSAAVDQWIVSLPLSACTPKPSHSHWGPVGWYLGRILGF